MQSFEGSFLTDNPIFWAVMLLGYFAFSIAVRLIPKENKTSFKVCVTIRNCIIYLLELELVYRVLGDFLYTYYR